MRDADDTKWWTWTVAMAGGTMAATAFLALLPVIVPALFGQSLVLGAPLPQFLVTTAAPVLVLVAIFVFAGRQLALDRRHDVSDR